MIKLLSSTDQPAFVEWFNQCLLKPEMAGIMPRRYSSPPELRDMTWERIALANMTEDGRYKAVIIFDVERDEVATVATVLLMTEASVYLKALIKPALRLLILNKVEYIEAAVSARNTRSVRLTGRLLSHPWGTKPKGILYKGEPTDMHCYRESLDDLTVNLSSLGLI